MTRAKIILILISHYVFLQCVYEIPSRHIIYQSLLLLLLTKSHHTGLTWMKSYVVGRILSCVHIHHVFLVSSCLVTTEWTSCLMFGGRITGSLQVWHGETWSGWRTLSGRSLWTFSSLCPWHWALSPCATCLRGAAHMISLCSVMMWVMRFEPILCKGTPDN